MLELVENSKPFPVTIVLISTDRDFVAGLSNLKNCGYTVLTITHDYSSSLRKIATQYWSFNAIVKSVKKADPEWQLARAKRIQARKLRKQQRLLKANLTSAATPILGKRHRGKFIAEGGTNIQPKVSSYNDESEPEDRSSAAIYSVAKSQLDADNESVSPDADAESSTSYRPSAPLQRHNKPKPRPSNTGLLGRSPSQVLESSSNDARSSDDEDEPPSRSPKRRKLQAALLGFNLVEP